MLSKRGGACLHDGLGHCGQHLPMGLIEQMRIDALGDAGAAVAHGAADLIHGDANAVGHGGKGVAEAVKGDGGRRRWETKSAKAADSALGCQGWPAASSTK